MIRDDAAQCAALTHHHARTFTVASRFLSAERRRAAFAVYAFCRVADDFVDEMARHAERAVDGSGAGRASTLGDVGDVGDVGDAPTGRALAMRQLTMHRDALCGAFAGEATTPLFRELRWAVHRYAIPAAPFHALLDMLYTDLSPVVYASWSDLERYCGGVASTVGEMCAHVFGLPASSSDRDDALRRARTLGVALQLTNILRDVGEDAGRGRCYLPEDELARFHLVRQDILDRTLGAGDARWQAFMRFQIARARALYADAAPGLRALDADARCCATICATGYAAILSAIERRGCDTLSGRARVGGVRKTIVMLSAWWSTRGTPPEARARRAMAPHGAPT